MNYGTAVKKVNVNIIRYILPWATLLIQSKYLLSSSSNMYCFSARTILIGFDWKNSLHDGLHNTAPHWQQLAIYTAYLQQCKTQRRRYKFIMIIVFLYRNLHFQPIYTETDECDKWTRKYNKEFVNFLASHTSNQNKLTHNYRVPHN